MTSLTLYYSPLSQPSRAVQVVLLLGKVDFTIKVIDLAKGEQKTPEYTAINPAQKVPAITEGDFKLFEGHAILRYLTTTRPSLKTYYPQDPQARALVDTYLDWHFLGTRKIASFLYEFFMLPKLYGKEEPSNRVERMKEVDDQLAFIENFFLGGEKKFKYIANQPSLTIADLSAHAEISAIFVINYDFSPYPALQAWYENIYQLPEVQDSYKVLNNRIKELTPELNEFNKRVVQ